MENTIVTGGFPARATLVASPLRTVRPRVTVPVVGMSTTAPFGSRTAQTSFPHVADPSQGLGSARTP